MIVDFTKLARIPVTHTPVTGSGSDSLGNTVPTYGAPAAAMAYSVGPHKAMHGSESITETETADVDMAMPKRVVSIKDRFTVDGTSYEVVAVRDQNLGFHRWQPGLVIAMRKA